MNEVNIIDKQEVEVIMSKEAAVELTKDIQSTTSALYILLKKAHDEKVWIAMGYKSWTNYIENEFEFSRTRSYQLINQANVIEEINEASGVSLYITEREARSIKKRLPEITERLEKDVKDAGLSIEDSKEKALDIINEETEEVDKSNKYHDKDDNEEDGYYEDNGSDMKEWKPEDIDMDKMKRMLSDDDKFIFDNLVITLKIFEEMPNAKEFGQTIKKSSESKKDLLKYADKAYSWITQLLDEIE
ncbi:MAG TPA: hypothetical protein GXZ90_08560 [Clostridiales bacterium]|nr:hypothetical protein [Clostridiales bacterium]